MTRKGKMIQKKNSWYHWLALMFKQFITETAMRPQYVVVDIYECKKTGFTKAILKLSERHTIEKNISDILTHHEYDKSNWRK